MSDEAALLLELVTPPDTGADEWRRWFDTVCLPIRLRVPGVRAGRRGRGYQNPGNQAIRDADPVDITLLDLESGAALRSSEWRAADGECAEALRSIASPPLSVDRMELRQIFSTTPNYLPPGLREATVLHGAFYKMPAQHQDEFHDWYIHEHIPIQMKVPGYLNARRFQGTTEPDRFVALYDVVSADHTTTPEAKRAMESAWSDRMRTKLAQERARRLFTVEAVQIASS